MMKTYRHKTLWWIAKKEETLIWICKIQDKNNYNYIDIKLIENSQDWEEVVETTDWIDEARNMYWEAWPDNDVNDFREAVIKHAPRVRFTENEIKKYYWERTRRQSIDIVCRFLQEHWLLEE